jgi:hypothetical protein
MLKEQRKDILFDLYTESTHNRKFNIFSIDSKNLNGKTDKISIYNNNRLTIYDLDYRTGGYKGYRSINIALNASKIPKGKLAYVHTFIDVTDYEEERNKINKDNDTSKVKNYYIHCQIEYKCIGKILITEPDNNEDRVGYEWIERYN